MKTPNSDEEVLNVHIVPHSHDDVGWLKTVDQYYSGGKNGIYHAGVQYILDTAIDELWRDPVKRFTYVEMGFFERWWRRQSEEIKDIVRVLIAEDRLEIVNGGYSMSDEATPYFEDFINNMRSGHEFLFREFGVTPRIGWSIDPFGHASASAALFSEMGFDAWFFARIDYQDKQRRLADKEMEFLWRPFSTNVGSSYEIFTHVLYHHYSAPQGFNWSLYGTDEPVVDDPELETYNVERRVEELYDWIIH